MQIFLEVMGNPKPQQRHRHFRYGTYDPCKQDKEQFLNSAKIYKTLDAPLIFPLYINIKFYMKRPKTHYRTGKYAGLIKEKWQNIIMDKKPDIDNLIKFVLDALQGENGYIVDDCQVVRIYAEKKYSKKPRTEIMIVEEYEEKN
jgi:Holliday junction resolvase RusA-like endonuclease